MVVGNPVDDIKTSEGEVLVDETVIVAVDIWSVIVEIFCAIGGVTEELTSTLEIVEDVADVKVTGGCSCAWMLFACPGNRIIITACV